MEHKMAKDGGRVAIVWILRARNVKWIHILPSQEVEVVNCGDFNARWVAITAQRG